MEQYTSNTPQQSMSSINFSIPSLKMTRGLSWSRLFLSIWAHVCKKTW